MGGKMKKIVYGVMAFAMVFLGRAESAHAAVGDIIAVDVNGAGFYHGVGELTNGATVHWATISGAQTGGGLLNADLTVSRSNGTYDASGAVTLAYSADASTSIDSFAASTFYNTPQQGLFDGYMTSSVGSSHLNFAGLDASKIYQLAVYSQVETNNPSALSINGTQVITNAHSTASTLLSGTNYFIINGLTSSGSGALNLTYGGRISGFQLKEVSSPAPEPSTIVLMGIGGLLFAVFSLRKSHVSNLVG